MNEKLLLFDFDGVLANTRALSYELNRRLYRDLTEAEFQRLFRGNIFSEVEKLKDRLINDPAFDDAGFYRAGLCALEFDTSLRAVLHMLNTDYLMGIVSSTWSEGIRAYLEMHGMEKYFAFMYGFESGLRKTDKIKKVLREYDSKPDKAVFITDTLGDITEAAHCGVAAIGVTWGFHDEKTLREGNPAAIVHTPQELEKSVRALLN